MNVVHNHPHHLAMKYVVPSNPEIAKKFGVVRVEDWHDRIRQETWHDMRAKGSKEAEKYVDLAHTHNAPMAPETCFSVVLCHTQSTGDVVLLHDDWLKDAQVVHE